MFEESAIRKCLEWQPLIAAMEDALAAFSTGGVLAPVRSVLEIEEGKYFGMMPAAYRDLVGLKAVTFYPANERAGIRTHHATIVLFDRATGTPLGAMDATAITEMRTAAVSAAITRRLRPAGGGALALVGSGVQARSHLAALRAVRSFDDVRVWSPTQEHAQRFAAEHDARAVELEAAVRGADVVVVATNAKSPVLKGEWLKSGAHVNAVGANRPTWRELDDAAMANVVLVDSREAARTESGDVLLSNAAIYAEIGEIFAGTKAPPPQTATTVFKSLGLAVEDLAAAALVLERQQRSEGLTGKV